MNGNVQVRLPENVLTALKQQHEANGISVSEQVRSKLKDVLENPGLIDIGESKKMKNTTLYLDLQIFEAFERLAKSKGISVTRALSLVLEASPQKRSE